MQLTRFWARDCRNYHNENSNSNILCNFFIQTKTSFGQIDTKNHKRFFNKTGQKIMNIIIISYLTNI